MSNESFASVTLPDYLNIEKSQESISYEPESDLDRSFNSESGSEYFPSEQEIRMREREMSDDEKKSNKKKTKVKKERIILITHSQMNFNPQK